MCGKKFYAFALAIILIEIYWPEKLHMTYVFTFILSSFLPLAISTSVPNNFSQRFFLTTSTDINVPSRAMIQTDHLP